MDHLMRASEHAELGVVTKKGSFSIYTAVQQNYVKKSLWLSFIQNLRRVPINLIVFSNMHAAMYGRHGSAS
jgi:hypothetical protein